LLILASASPRRRELLAAAGYDFEIEPAGIDEDALDATDPLETARELARRKAVSVAGRHRGESVWVLGADTVVAVEAQGTWHLLGKPEDAGEAARFLERLSGSRHQVVTGICVHAPHGESLVEVERTWVTMRPIAPEERAAYVASGEWRGKAGGYAIQENADAFVTRLEEGGFDNVVGLPVARVGRLLARAGYDASAAGDRTG
jgi:septum formation protein